MTEFRRTHTVTDIDWHKVFEAYESMYFCRIDGAIPQPAFDERRTEIGRRFGACWVYNEGDHFGKLMFRDEILAGLGIHFGYEEDE